MPTGNEDTTQFLEWRPGVLTRMHASHAQGAECLCVFEQLCEPGAGAPWHRHDVEEVIVVVEGRAGFQLTESESELAAGRSVRIPAGRRHAFTNVGETTLRLIAIFASATPQTEYEGPEGNVVIGRETGRHRTTVTVTRS